MRFKAYIYISLTILLTFIVYSGVLSNGFVNWDDFYYLNSNFFLDGFSFSKLKLFYSEGIYLKFNLFQYFSYSFDYSIFGLDPFYFHLHSIILHLINTILVYFFIQFLLNNNTIAISTSLLFAISTINVEVVAWTAERNHLLFTAYYLCSLIFYLKYLSTAQGNTISFFKRYRFYLLSLLFFIFSLLSKQMAIPLPIVLYGIDYFYQRKLFCKKVVFEKLPFFIISIFFGIILLIGRENRHIESIASSFTYIERIIFACYAYTQYIIKSVFPYNLSAIYPYPDNSNNLPIIYYISIAFSLFSVILFFKFIIQRKRFIIFCFVFFFANIIFVLQVFFSNHSYIMADRYSYLSGIGFYLLISYSIHKFIISRKIIFIIFIPVFVCYISTMTIFTYQRGLIWKDTITLFTDVLTKHPKSLEALNNRGLSLRDSGDIDAALSDFNEAIRISDDYDKTYINRGNTFFLQEKYDSAISDFSKVIKLLPSKADAYSNRGRAYYKAGLKEKAMNDINHAIKLAPNFATAYYNRGTMKMHDKKFRESISDYSLAIKFDNRNKDAYFYRGVLLYHFEEKESACLDWERALLLGNKKAAITIKKYCLFN